MTAISVTSVLVLDNPSLVSNPLQFEIQYECLYDLQDGKQGLRWLCSPYRPPELLHAGQKAFRRRRSLGG